MTVRILAGDMRVRLRDLADGSIDAVVTDPPYHLSSIVKRFGAGDARPAAVGATGAYARASKGFMGQTWDGGDVAFQVGTWAEVFRVMKPGAHLVAFSGTRTYHRMVTAIEDAGFEIRDQLAWLYGSGFPKSHDVSKGIDRAAGADRDVVGQVRRTGKSSGIYGAMAGDSQVTAAATADAVRWEGWGTALKPAIEPIVLARKPLTGSVASNVLAHGTGALNIDACRIGDVGSRNNGRKAGSNGIYGHIGATTPIDYGQGRWPANVAHDGSDEVLAGFPDTSSGGYPAEGRQRSQRAVYGKPTVCGEQLFTKSSGSAARFFYSAKADQAERHAGCGDLDGGNHHPTVKPFDLMRWLVRLITPPGGTVLDPFMGSGSTLIAADAEQFDAIGVELSSDYIAIAERRLSAAGGMFARVEVA